MHKHVQLNIEIPTLNPTNPIKTRPKLQNNLIKHRPHQQNILTPQPKSPINLNLPKTMALV